MKKALLEHKYAVPHVLLIYIDLILEDIVSEPVAIGCRKLSSGLLTEHLRASRKHSLPARVLEKATDPKLDRNANNIRHLSSNDGPTSCSGEALRAGVGVTQLAQLWTRTRLCVTVWGSNATAPDVLRPALG